MRSTFTIAIAATILAAGGCSDEVVESAPIVRPVKLLTLGARGPGQTLEFPGTVEATQQVEMGFEVPGKVVEFPVIEGQRVETGTLLARLDLRDFESKHAGAIASYRAAQAEYARQQALFDADVAPEQTLEKAKRNAEMVAARVELTAKALEDATLRAPFPGVVARKLIDDMANVQAKQTVLIFQDDSSLEVTIDVPERIFVAATPGLSHEERTARLKPRVTLTALPGRSLPAQVKEIAATADPATRTFEARLTFDAPKETNVRPGMTATVTISVPSNTGSTSTSSRFAIPASAALADENGKAYVWKVDVDAMVVSRAPVVLGDLSGSDVRVESGLANGDTIAISVVHQLREGMKVRRLEN